MKIGSTQPVSVRDFQLSTETKNILKSWKLETAKSVVIYGYAPKSLTSAEETALGKRFADNIAASQSKRIAAIVGQWVGMTWPNLTVKTVGQGTRINRICKKLDNQCAMIKIVTLAKTKK
jgi:hypothetical protein